MQAYYLHDESKLQAFYWLFHPEKVANKKSLFKTPFSVFSRFDAEYTAMAHHHFIMLLPYIC